LRALGLAFLLATLLAPPNVAQAPVRVVQRQQSHVFSESLEFSLTAESQTPVIDVILFYGRDGARLVRRIYPQFTPGARLTVDHTEEIESGQFAPGTLLRTWWELSLQDGSVFRTPVETFEYTDDNHDWQSIASAKARLYYYGKTLPAAKDLLARADEAVALLQEQIGISLEQPVRIYVYNSSRDMQAALSTRSESYDSRVVTLGVAVAEDTLLLLGDHRDAQQTLAHELSHIVVGLATDNPYADLPRWLDEGLAMYAEGKLPLDNQRALDRAIRSAVLPSIRSMSSYTSQAGEVDLFYGAVFSVVHFMLREYGRDRMTELLQVFSQGSRQEEALQEVYGFGLAELDSRWRASLGLQPRGAPTPQALLESAPASPARSPADSLGNAVRRILDLLRRALWNSSPEAY
jgi:hypothetical protein